MSGEYMQRRTQPETRIPFQGTYPPRSKSPSILSDTVALPLAIFARKWLGSVPAVVVCNQCAREFKTPIASLKRTSDAQESLVSSSLNPNALARWKATRCAVATNFRGESRSSRGISIAVSVKKIGALDTTSLPVNPCQSSARIPRKPSGSRRGCDGDSFHHGSRTRPRLPA